jgi:hypothetical protein
MCYSYCALGPTNPEKRGTERADVLNKRAKTGVWIRENRGLLVLSDPIQTWNPWYETNSLTLDLLRSRKLAKKFSTESISSKSHPTTPAQVS